MSKNESKKPDSKAVEAEESKEEATAEAATKDEQQPSEAQRLQAELDSLNDRFLRTLAEYDNYRKRSQKEKEAAYGDSRAGVISQLLPVMDNFERAMANKDASHEDYVKGIDMIFSQLEDFLKKLSVESFGEKGDEFDPNIHNAVMHIEDENEGENTVVEVFSKGYRMDGRIIRPAMVKVAN